MWTVVYIAPNTAAAERARALLTQEGFLVRLRPVEVDEAGRGSVEVLVNEGEAEEAQEVIAQHLAQLR
ncbi:conserved protein of unknown function [Candidatus Hydrogenisulfobacillus filiaventi]|uniref:DUF2007 domain-containing protein n=1 Tax=Candidatus Hydrogenisulfobacillus filiaventi TaxID=2707344 RepID=A0A6F8ZEZ0_9FIRM|nr:DUF2007 domain-containing protein [Bacillota bacterium]CAB1128501.1 conserved protein of unknown function [Candidatus Hydrogenisulfobacillus filiaventi]